MESRYKGDGVTLLEDAASGFKKLPVGIIDKYYDPRTDRWPLNEHLLLLLQVMASEVVNQLLNSPCTLSLDVDPLFALEKSLQASAISTGVNSEYIN